MNNNSNKQLRSNARLREALFRKGPMTADNMQLAFPGGKFFNASNRTFLLQKNDPSLYASLFPNIDEVVTNNRGNRKRAPLKNSRSATNNGLLKNRAENNRAPRIAWSKTNKKAANNNRTTRTVSPVSLSALSKMRNRNPLQFAPDDSHLSNGRSNSGNSNQNSWTGSTLSQATMSHTSDAAQSELSSSSEISGMMGLSLESQYAVMSVVQELRNEMSSRLERLEGGVNAIRVTTAEGKELQLAAASFMDVPRKDLPKWLGLQYKKGGLNVLKKVVYDPAHFVIKDMVGGSVVATVTFFGRPLKIVIQLWITIVVVGEAVHLFYCLPAVVQTSTVDAGRAAFATLTNLGMQWYESRLGMVNGIIGSVADNLQLTAQATICNPVYQATGWLARSNPWFYIRPALCRA